MTRGRKQSAMSLLRARATKDCVVDGSVSCRRLFPVCESR